MNPQTLDMIASIIFHLDEEPNKRASIARAFARRFAKEYRFFDVAKFMKACTGGTNG